MDLSSLTAIPIHSLYEWYDTPHRDPPYDKGLQYYLFQLLQNTSAISSKLTDIYDRLEHIKIDSYVNARIVDETGGIPVPCTEVTGLLVTAFADAPINVQVQNTPLQVTTDGTTPLMVRPQVKDPWNGNWYDQLGFHSGQYQYLDNGAFVSGEQSGAVAMTAQTGVQTNAYDHMLVQTCDPGLVNGALAVAKLYPGPTSS